MTPRLKNIYIFFLTSNKYTVRNTNQINLKLKFKKQLFKSLRSQLIDFQPLKRNFFPFKNIEE